MKYLFIILIFAMLITAILVVHKQTSGGKNIMAIEKEVPLLNSIEEIKSFKATPTIQYSEPIGPARS